MSTDPDGEVFVPCRREIWQVDLEPTRGSELRKERPCLVISEKGFNRNPLHLCFIAPVSSKVKDVPWHVRFDDSQVSGNVDSGAIRCDHTRSVCYRSEEEAEEEDRFLDPRGRIEDPSVMEQVSEIIGEHIVRHVPSPVQVRN